MLNQRQKSSQFPQTSVLFHMIPMKVSLMFHFLIWTSAWNILHFLEF